MAAIGSPLVMILILAILIYLAKWNANRRK
jgi:hypothetical protein